MFSRSACFQHTEVWMDSRVSVYTGAVRTPKRPERSVPYPLSRPASTRCSVHFDTNEHPGTSDPPTTQRPPTPAHTRSPAPTVTTSGLSQNPGPSGSSRCNSCQSGQQENFDEDQLVDDHNSPNNTSNSCLMTYAITTSLDDDELIPKPKGEAGRPGSGGYTLEAALGWPDQKYAAVKDHVKEQVLDTLDLNVCMTKQPKKSIGNIKETSLAKFPFLSKYKNLWPVTDFIPSNLKYRKTALKREQDSASLKELQEVIVVRTAVNPRVVEGGGSSSITTPRRLLRNRKSNN
ncbi:hypothetical protein PM082_015309 [Marasmius tenuissimus]|nr:hypothetical protein PM082_015309 [Marasmius tenuissimus]